MKMGQRYFTGIVRVSLAICSIWMFGEALNVQGCRVLQFASPKVGKALVNHVIKNISVGSPDVCEIECYLDNRCLSYNYGDRGNVRHKCELSDSDHKHYPRDLQQRLEFSYRGTENDCSRNPCPENKKCNIDVSDNEHRCQCFQGFSGEHCEPVRTGGWRKINDDPVCFSALDDRYGAFTIKEDGFIDNFKLVHRRGRGIKCNRNFPAAYWGCLNRNNEPDILTTVITFSNNTALPIANYSETISNTGALCRYYAYKISGVEVNSKELIFEGLESPLWVKIGEEFRIWHGHDLVDCDEENNSGHTCADAYAWYF